LAAAFLFGSTFVVMKSAVETAEPVPFLSARFLLAALVLAPIAWKRSASPRLWQDGALAAAALGGSLLANHDRPLSAAASERLERAERSARDRTREVRRLRARLRTSRARARVLERRRRSAVRRRRDTSAELRRTRRALSAATTTTPTAVP